MLSIRISPRGLAAVAIIVAGIGIFAAILLFGYDNKKTTTGDYIQYWALEQQLAHGGNPYDPVALLRTERAVGMDGPAARVSLSPPVGLVYALPLGWVSAKLGLALWTLLLLGCTGVSIALLWRLHGRPKTEWHLIGLGFPPVLWCFAVGQLGIFFLLEIVLFLYFLRRHPWLAGASLALCMLKPHLFLPCAVALALWSIRRRQFSLIGGFLLGVAVSSGLTMIVDPQVWSQYLHTMRVGQIMDVYLPTLGVSMRFLIDRQAHWIEFIPELAACAWAAWYFLTRRDRWDWGREGMLVLLISVAASPYSWYSDQAMLFPAVLAGIYLSDKSARVLVPFGVLAIVGLIVFQVPVPMTSAFYVWTAPAWLAWYLYATHRTSVSNPAEEALAAAIRPTSN